MYMYSEDLIGQSLLAEKLRAFVSVGRIVHAYLFTGPKGAGKKTLAALFARTLLCGGRGDKPCQVCHACRQTATGNHPDIQWVRPEEGKTGIGVDQIRDLQSDIKVKPYQGPYKIYLLDQAHTLTEQSQNALLKTLEEPPRDALLFLLANSTSGLLPTLRSRCQLMRLAPLTQEEISTLIQKRCALSNDEAHFFAALSQGIPGTALQYASSDEYRAMRTSLLEGLQSPSALQLWPLFLGHRDQSDALLDILLLWFRDILILKETGNEDKLINLDKIPWLKAHAEGFTFSLVQDMIELIENTRTMIKNNVNYQLAVENMLIDIQGGIRCSS